MSKRKNKTVQDRLQWKYGLQSLKEAYDFQLETVKVSEDKTLKGS